jgi:hypothetical protein
MGGVSYAYFLLSEVLVVLSIQIDGCQWTTVADVNTNAEISLGKIVWRLGAIGVYGQKAKAMQRRVILIGGGRVTDPPLHRVNSGFDVEWRFRILLGRISE